MADLAIDTRVEGNGGRYRASISRDWEVWGPNGGYVSVIALRAAGVETALRRPASFACQYLNVADFGEVDLAVRTLRASRRAAALGVSMTQAGRPILEALVWVVDDDGAGLEHDVTNMPDVPRPEALQSYEDLRPEGYPWFPFWQNLETRPIGWQRERTPGPPVWRAWLRYRPTPTFEDPFLDAGRALLHLDTTMWPAAHGPHVDPAYIAPNMDLAVQFHRAAPDDEWLLCDATAPLAEGGLVGCHARVWSESGRLLATGTSQLFCRPNPQRAKN
jgi:acyl-CoA thioesterase-2